MLVLTPVSAIQSGFYAYPGITSTPFQSYETQLDLAAQQATYEYALAHARIEALRRERVRHRRLVEEASRGQVIRDALYRQQVTDAMSYASHFSDAYTWPAFQYPLEELIQQRVLEGRQHRAAFLARQRELDFARAMAYPQQLAAAQRRGSAFCPTSYPQDALAATPPTDRAAHWRPVVHPVVAKPTRSQPTVCPVHEGAQLRDRFLHDVDLEVRDKLHNMLSHFGLPGTRPDTLPADRKGKGKAKEAKDDSIGRSPLSAGPSLLDSLTSRMQTETDPDAQESLETLVRDLFGLPGTSGGSKPSTSSAPVDAKGKGKEKEVRFDIPVASTSTSRTSSFSVPVQSASIARPEHVSQQKPEEPQLHRASALSPALAAKNLSFYRTHRARKTSLSEIGEIEATLHALEASFVLPTNLDFAPPVSDAASENSATSAANGLAYTPNNSPVHSYEHALNDLLTQLDAVESGGNLEVRGRRKEVVRKVEQALEDVGKRVEESRERSSERAKTPERAAASVGVTSAVSEGAEFLADVIAPAANNVVGEYALEDSALGESAPDNSAHSPSPLADDVLSSISTIRDTKPEAVQSVEFVQTPVAVIPRDEKARSAEFEASTAADHTSAAVTSPATTTTPYIDSSVDSATNTTATQAALSAEAVGTAPGVQSPQPSDPPEDATTAQAAETSSSPSLAVSRDLLERVAGAAPAENTLHTRASLKGDPDIVATVDDARGGRADAGVVGDDIASADSAARDAFLLSSSPVTVSRNVLPAEDVEIIHAHEAMSDGEWSEVDA